MEVNPHTSLKHRLLGVYFKICRQVMKNRILNYIDLYSGDGECVCPRAPKTKWEPPFLASLLKNAEKENLQLKCFLNDIDPDVCKSLETKTRSFENFLLCPIQNQDANNVYTKALELFPPSEWSIFYLDPCNHSQLDWTTIEGISQHTRAERNEERKPELIINLMTNTMQRVVQSRPDSISKALGSDHWKALLPEYQERGDQIYKLFRDVFVERLQGLGYKTATVEIAQTLPHRSVLYYMIFATSLSSVESIHQRFEKDCKKYISDKWTKENFTFNMMHKAKIRGYGSLESFFK